MSRQYILNQLNQYTPYSKQQESQLKHMLHFIMAHENCFERSNAIGHITGSAWLINQTGDKVLLTLHKKLNLWLQLGGHADGDFDILNVALKEAKEESGISQIKPIKNTIFDIDIHLIPPHKNTPQHYHYDIRFLLQAFSEKYQVSTESHALAWFTYDDIMRLNTVMDTSVKRMAEKWQTQFCCILP